jgi:hypothetical protein
LLFAEGLWGVEDPKTLKNFQQLHTQQVLGNQVPEGTVKLLGQRGEFLS